MSSTSVSICFHKEPSSLLFRGEHYLPPLPLILPKEGAICQNDEIRRKVTLTCGSKCLVIGFGMGEEP